MPNGAKTVEQSMDAVRHQLKQTLAAANCEITDDRDRTIVFRHGTYMTQSAPLLPKRGRFMLSETGGGTQIDYQIEVVGPARAWMSLVALLTCWAIFPPILIYRALTYHPKRFVENMLGAF